VSIKINQEIKLIIHYIDETIHEVSCAFFWWGPLQKKRKPNWILKRKQFNGIVIISSMSCQEWVPDLGLVVLAVFLFSWSKYQKSSLSRKILEELNHFRPQSLRFSLPKRDWHEQKKTRGLALVSTESLRRSYNTDVLLHVFLKGVNRVTYLIFLIKFQIYNWKKRLQPHNLR